MGQVKTRLTPPLTAPQALRLHRAFLEDTVDRTAGLTPTRFLYLADAPPRTERRILPASLRHRVEVRRQTGADLGERMWNAVRETLASSSRVVLMGTDTPSLPLHLLQRAFQALERTPVVLGPVRDGGYYLLGMVEPRRELFQGIPWGTPKVLEETRLRLSEPEYELLPPWYDVDVWEDLVQLQRDLENPFPGFPHRTQAAVKEIFAAWQG